MAGHHRSRGPVVRHAGSFAPHAVSAGGVTHQVHLVGIDIQVCDRHLDDRLIKGIRLRAEVKVPGIGDGTGAEVDAFGRLIESLLVVPLLVIRFLRSTTAAMEGNVQRTAIRRLFAIDCPPDGHRIGSYDQLMVPICRRESRPHSIPPLLLHRAQIAVESQFLFFGRIRFAGRAVTPPKQGRGQDGQNGQ